MIIGVQMRVNDRRQSAYNSKTKVKKPLLTPENQYFGWDVLPTAPPSNRPEDKDDNVDPFRMFSSLSQTYIEPSQPVSFDFSFTPVMLQRTDFNYSQSNTDSLSLIFVCVVIGVIWHLGETYKCVCLLCE